MAATSTRTACHVKAPRANVYRALLDARAVATWMVPREFETTDAAMRGETRVTFTPTDASEGTDVLAVHEDRPPSLSRADNEASWWMALDKLAAFVEGSCR